MIKRNKNYSFSFTSKLNKEGRNLLTSLLPGGDRDINFWTFFGFIFFIACLNKNNEAIANTYWTLT